VAFARTIRPALAHALVIARESMCTSMEKSPVTFFHTKWNESASPQMSRPLPRTVNDAPSSAGASADPPPSALTAPTSACNQPSGSDPPGVEVIVNGGDVPAKETAGEPLLTRIRPLVVGGPGLFQMHVDTSTGTVAHSAIVENAAWSSGLNATTQ